MLNTVKNTIEDWSKPFIACLLGMTSGIDLTPGHLFIAFKTATITLLLGLLIKKIKG